MLKNGDKEAFSELIELLKMDLYKIAKTRLQSEDDISDVMQETIICAYKSIKSLKKPESFKKWLIKILVNHCNDTYKKKANSQISLEDVDEKVYSFQSKDLENMEMEDLLKILKEDEKLIITLYYLENYTSREIAEILEMNENTIKTKVARAKAKIRNQLRWEEGING